MTESLTSFLMETVTYGQATERLLATIAINGQILDAISRAIDLDGDLAPELKVAVDSAEALSAALNSALTVVQTKYDLAVDALRTQLEEGGDVAS